MLLSKSEVLFLFEEIMLGKITYKNKERENYAIFKGEDDEDKLYYIGIILRYICEDIYGMDMKEVAKNLKPSILTDFHIDKLIPTLKKHKILYFVNNVELCVFNMNNLLLYMYPEKYKNSDLQKHIIIDSYKQIARIDEYKYSKRVRIDKNFFDIAHNGVQNMAYVLRYLDATYLSHMTIDEKYNFFSTNKCNSFLKRFRIYRPLDILFDGDFLRGFYELQSNVDKNPFLYMKHCVNNYAYA